MQPVETSHASVVQALPSSQPSRVPLKHAPPPHTSPLVHAFPSEHAVTALVCAQPTPVWQLSSVQELPSSHPSVCVPRQLPLMQMSKSVHGSPSLQPAVLAPLTQPLKTPHASSVHGLLSSHVVAAPARQTAPPQTSPIVHALPSEQGSRFAVCVHPLVGSHASSVHGLPSLQTNAPPGRHVESPHASPIVHASPSLHAEVLGACWQPLAVSQLSVVHGFPSSQNVAGPA